MTENEAIKVLEKPSKHIRMVHKTKNEMEFYTFSSDLVESFEMAIQALEEIQQYRAIFTIEDFKALKEKNEPKKVINIHKSECPEDVQYFGVDELYGDCPHCGGLVNLTWNTCNCGDCGGLIDWSE